MNDLHHGKVVVDLGPGVDRVVGGAPRVEAFGVGLPLRADRLDGLPVPGLHRRQVPVIQQQRGDEAAWGWRG